MTHLAIERELDVLLEEATQELLPLVQKHLHCSMKVCTLAVINSKYHQRPLGDKSIYLSEASVDDRVVLATELHHPSEIPKGYILGVNLRYVRHSWLKSSLPELWVLADAVRKRGDLEGKLTSVLLFIVYLARRSLILTNRNITAFGSSARERVQTKLIPDILSDPCFTLVSSMIMHWAKAPVHGSLSSTTMRGYTVTLDNDNITAWVSGGSFEQDFSNDLCKFNYETMASSRLRTGGDLPPPIHAHTATLIDQCIVVQGGGHGQVHYDTPYVFNTITGTVYLRPYIYPLYYPKPQTNGRMK
ncbi:hypothetical protein DL96DRAFT_1713017 [Flagelloscypha sp. PMI_526]|nr:hypothetical protein DL96DRAFT_1713017 [Flagelloscypha sp. PMI_526]